MENRTRQGTNDGNSGWAGSVKWGRMGLFEDFIDAFT